MALHAANLSVIVDCAKGGEAQLHHAVLSLPLPQKYRGGGGEKYDEKKGHGLRTGAVLVKKKGTPLLC